MIIYLIRHGKTFCNEQKLYCGKSDVSLSEIGKNELLLKKSKIKYPIVKNNYTSGAKRANETFEMLYPNKKYEIIEDFLEYNFGDFELKSYDMLKENEDYIKWISDETLNVCCPNGESKKQFYERLKNCFINFIKYLESKEENEVLIICHGGTIGTLLYLFYDNSKNFFEYQPPCGEGYKLNITLEFNNLKINSFNTI